MLPSLMTLGKLPCRSQLPVADGIPLTRSENWILVSQEVVDERTFYQDFFQEELVVPLVPLGLITCRKNDEVSGTANVDARCAR